MPAGSAATVTERSAYVWGIRAMRIIGVAALVVTTARAHPAPSGQGRGLAVACVLAVAALAWTVWTLAERHRRATTVALAVMAVAGGLLGGLTPHSFAITFAAVAALAAGGILAPDVSIAITVAAGLALAAGTLAVGGATSTLLGYLVLIGTGLGAGFIRFGYVQRADQAERLLAETRRARDAEAHAAALAERTRIAREIHDILAHSLGALSMQLEAAQALLTASPAHADPNVAKALQCVERSGQLTREGLTETRRAVLALREDTAPLPQMLTALADSRRTGEHGRKAPQLTVHTRGVPRRLEPDTSLALYRTAQEAVTNAAKHAPGEPVTLDLEYAPDHVTLTASNPLPATATPRPLGASGSGYGLTGLRERAELAGGTLTAGAVDTTWSLCITIPT